MKIIQSHKSSYDSEQIEEELNYVDVEKCSTHEVVIQLHSIFSVSHYQLSINYQVKCI